MPKNWRQIQFFETARKNKIGSDFTKYVSICMAVVLGLFLILLSFKASALPSWVNFVDLKGSLVVLAILIIIFSILKTLEDHLS